MGEKADVNAKWDACLDHSVRRVFYTTLGGAFGALLLFRSPVSRWATVTLGAGVGIGSAYSDCSRVFDEPVAKYATPKRPIAPLVDSEPPQTPPNVPAQQDSQA